MDESLLPPPLTQRKPFPWRTVMAFFLPAASLAAGTGLQRWLDSTAPDPILRWLAWSSAAGVLIGLAFRRKLLWAAYGLAAPWIAAGLVAGAVASARPAREHLADRREAACRAEGRPLCSIREFEAACARRDLTSLGPPRQSICAGASCTRRWLYRGPFRPEQLPSRGGVLCSIVDGARSSTIAVADP